MVRTKGRDREILESRPPIQPKGAVTVMMIMWRIAITLALSSGLTLRATRDRASICRVPRPNPSKIRETHNMIYLIGLSTGVRIRRV